MKNQKGFDSDFIEQLKSKSDIVEIIRSYIPVEQRGRGFWARCPFHHEKTPSFSINKDGQFYHCFGCGKSGDVIRFVMEMESLDFMDACKVLADRAKIPMPDFRYDSEKAAENRQKKERLLSLLKDTARFYVANIMGGHADQHVEYVLSRGMTAETVRTFGIGASLDFNGLIHHLKEKGYAKQEMIDAGVADEKDGRLRDALGGRLIFPLINSLGDVVAFGGRVMKKTDFAKYKNTRETQIFEKSKNLYNLNRLKQLKNEKGLTDVIMVEGYMDTVSLYQAGFKNVVASMGTSLTKDQARLIKRYTDKVLICYDGDGAGQKATVRGLEILKDEGISVRVVALPEGKDPDEVIKEGGVQAFQKCLDEAMPLIDFKLYNLRRSYDLDNAESKRAYVSAAIKVVATAESSAEKEELLKVIRRQTGITYESLKRDLEKSEQSPQEKAPTKIEITPPEAGDKYLQARRFILCSVLLEKPYAEGFLPEEEDFTDSAHQAIVRYVLHQKERGERMQPSMLFEALDEEYVKEAEEVLAVGAGDYLDYADAKKYFADCKQALSRARIEREIEALVKLCNHETDVERRKQYAKMLQERTRALGKRK